MKNGVLKEMLCRLAEHLRDAGKIDLTEGFIDGTHAGAKKGAHWLASLDAAKATKIMAVADGHGLPIAIGIAGGERGETTLVEETLDAALEKRHRNDRARERPAYNNVQDGRRLRRYRRRWKAERLFAWLMRFRRVVTRYERKADNLLGFVHLGCIAILLRRL